MKTLIDLDKEVWARVKYFATIKEWTLNESVEYLLDKALDSKDK